MFESIKGVIAARIQPRSENNANTYSHFVDELQKSYNLKVDAVLQGSET
jgi:hypothetical protein